MKLNVYFGNEKAGTLESTENRGVIFVYDKNYAINKNAVPLSASLPLQSESILGEDDPHFAETSFALNAENYELVDDNRLSDFIEKMNARPLIKADDKLRLSLAGAQEKLALAKLDGKWYLPLNGASSTHILKPTRTGSLSSLAQNEYICMKLAKSFGLPVPDVDLLNIAGREVFVVNILLSKAPAKTPPAYCNQVFC